MQKLRVFYEVLLKKTGNFHAAGPVNEPIPFPGGREERKGKFDII